MKPGAPRKGEDPGRVALLEDAIWMAKSGASDEEIMARQGYVNRESWLRSLIRAGLPKVSGPHNRLVTVADRLVGYVFVPEPVKHGTASGYSHGGCRCAECRAWNCRRAKAARVARQLAAIPDHVKHGTENAYRNYGCRCEDCRTCNRLIQRAAYARRKAARDAGA